MNILERNLTYLAVPYAHDDVSVRKNRFELVSKVGAWLISNGHVVYSPITHCHPMAKYGLPEGWQFWQHMDIPYLQYTRLFIVLPLEGWRSSVGLKAELAEAKRLELPIAYVSGNLKSCDHQSLTLKWTPPAQAFK